MAPAPCSGHRLGGLGAPMGLPYSQVRVVPVRLGGGRGGLAVALAFSRAAWPWAPLQAKKTYQVYHTESMSAEAKLREAERQEGKRAGRSAAPATAATAVEAGPLRKTSVKKGSRLVEKVGLGAMGQCEGSDSWPLSLQARALTGAC